ncbi:hypothetical protein [Neosynechococcus sphagnicola]|nr:hypothetical protein [Neosynechococcus sphagnicola]
MRRPGFQRHLYWGDPLRVLLGITPIDPRCRQAGLASYNVG